MSGFFGSYRLRRKKSGKIRESAYRNAQLRRISRRRSLGGNTAAQLRRRREDFINGTAVDSFNSIYHVYGSSSSYYPGYYGGLTAAGTTLYYSSPSDIRFYDTVTKETGTLGIDSEVSISSCRYDRNGILSVFFSKKPNNYDDSGSREITLFSAGDPDGYGIVSSSDLVTVQKYLLTGSLDINWAVYDVTGNIGIDILDFIRIKKLSAR